MDGKQLFLPTNRTDIKIMFRNFIHVLTTAALAGGLLIGCGSDRPDTPAAKPTWSMTLSLDGVEHQEPIHMFNVYLTDTDAWPELFEFEGKHLNLVGAFPLDVRIGYGENWKVLIGKTFPILHKNPKSRDAVGPSFVTLAGKKYEVMGGSFTFDKFTGQWAGLRGDMTLQGKIQLQLKDGDQIQEATGTFAAHCVSWG